MRATLSFNLNEEQHEYHCAVNGMKYHGVIDSLLGELRILEKYSNLDESQLKVVEQIREWLAMELECAGVDTDF